MAQTFRAFKESRLRNLFPDKRGLIRGQERKTHPTLIMGDSNYSDIDWDNKFTKTPEKERYSSGILLFAGFAESSPVKSKSI